VKGQIGLSQKKKKKLRLILLCLTRLEKGIRKKNNNQYDIQTPEKQKKRNRRITVHLTSVQKKVMEQEVTLSAVKGGRDVL
jgi:hypothetical protein